MAAMIEPFVSPRRATLAGRTTSASDAMGSHDVEPQVHSWITDLEPGSELRNFSRSTTPFTRCTTRGSAGSRDECPTSPFLSRRHPCMNEAILGDSFDRVLVLQERISEEPLPLSKAPSAVPQPGQQFYPAFVDIAPNLLAGTIAGLKTVLGMVLFANIIFNSVDDPNVKRYFPAAVNINLLSACIHLSVAAIWSDMNVLAAPQDIPSLVLSELIVPLSEALEDMGINDPYALGNMMVASMLISAVIGGIFCFVLGRYGAGSIFQKIPTPVVGGFISAMGADAVFSTLSMLTNTKFSVAWPDDFKAFSHRSTWAHLSFGLATLFSIRYLPSWITPLVKSKFLNALVIPICLLSPLITFYIVLVSRGQFEADMAWMRQRDWLYQEFNVSSAGHTVERIWSAWGCQLDHVYWRAFFYPKVIMMMLVLQILSTLAAVLGLIGAHNTGLVPSRGRLNIDRELRVIGVQNLLSGAAGGNYGYVQMGMSVNLFKDGGTHRLAHLTTITFVFLVYISGFPISAYVPKFFLCGIFLNLGVTFIQSNLVEQCGRMGKPSYASMWAIVIFSRMVNLNAAVLLGFAIQVAIMVCVAASQDPVVSMVSTSLVASRKLRSVWEQELLRKSRRLLVARMRGPVFFGSSSKLTCFFEKVLLDEVNPKPSFIIIDLEEVTVFDDTAAYLLVSFEKDLAKAEIRLFFAGAGSWEWMLQRQGWVRYHQPNAFNTNKQPAIFEMLDDALQCCEDLILQNLHEKAPAGKPLRFPRTLSTNITMSFPSNSDGLVSAWPSGSDGRSALSRKHVTATMGSLDRESLAQVCSMTVAQWNKLCGYCENMQLPVDAVIYESSTKCDSMFILIQGVVEMWQGQVRKRRTVALDLLGAACFCAKTDHVESAFVVSVDGARLLELTTKQLSAMKVECKDVYDAFIEKLLLRVMGRNLVFT